MRLLLDHCVDRRLARLLTGYDVTTARKMGWDGLKNGLLVAAAERDGFEVLVTTDKNLRYQQNLAGRTIAIITLDALFTTLANLKPLVPALLDALADLVPGSFVVVRPPDEA